MRFGLILLLLAPPLGAQQPASAPSPEVLAAAQAATADYATKRELALAPALEFVHKNDYVAAYSAIQPALTAYPNDLRVLFLAGDAARISGEFPQALDLYKRCLNLKISSMGAIHLGLIRTDADMGQWEDFNKERAVVRQMALAGDPTLSLETGYLIEDHRETNLHFQVQEFPGTDSSAITRYRFSFISSRQQSTRFTPSIDLESNPIDDPSFAREFPRKAAAHVREYALISYPDPHTRAFLKYYSNGEPPYEDVRADVIAALSSLKKPVAEPGHHRPAYHPAPK